MRSGSVVKLSLLVLCLLCSCSVAQAQAQTTSFTYQGRLTDGGAPANGLYDLQFKVFDAQTIGTGTQQPQPTPISVTLTNVSVNAGVFIVQLDFGAGAFPGAARFLEIGVKRPAESSFTPLSPRQQITSTPYAMRSLSAEAIVIGGQRVLNVSGTVGLPNTNTFAGVGAGSSNTPGGGPNLLSGSFNSFFGDRAGFTNTEGFGNSFFGSLAGFNNTKGHNNSFFGVGAGDNNTLGSFNIFIGRSAGGNNTEGSANSFLGVDAGLSNTTENNNTFIGVGSNGQAGISNATAIGSGAKVTQSNSLVLGSINGTNGATANTNVGIGTSSPVGNLQVNVQSSPNPIRALTLDVESFQTPGNALASYFFKAIDIGAGGASAFLIRGDGNVGIGTDTPGAKLDVNGTLKLAAPAPGGGAVLCRDLATGLIINCSASSASYKANIFGLHAGLDVVSRLRPVSFTWKSDGRKDMGLVAEEVNRVEPLLNTYDAAGAVAGVRYDRLSVVLINAVKEQQTQIEEQRNEIVALRTANATLSSRLQAIERRLRNSGGPSRRRR